MEIELNNNQINVAPDITGANIKFNVAGLTVTLTCEEAEALADQLENAARLTKMI